MTATAQPSAAAPSARAYRHSLGGLAARRVALAAQWGGSYATAGGAVRVRVSEAYPEDAALPQRWADYLASLIHGAELQTVSLYLAPPAEVRSLCGRGALACYSGRGGVIVASPEDLGGIGAEAVVAHEYGHHVAASRSNAPWESVDYGTKRWASYVGVCARARAGELFPGVEGDERYTLNPGEAFAEAYRVLNERRLGRAESPWSVVSQQLYPSEAALAALEQDVTRPWTSNLRTSYAGSLSRRTRTRTYSVSTPLDGTLSAAVRTPNARIALELYDSSGRRVARTVVPRGASRSLSAVVCGKRSVRARVRLVGRAGRFRLQLSTP